MSYKNLTHTIRDILEGKSEDPNAQDLAKLKKVAKVKDEEKAEEKLDAMEALEYGDQSAKQYAKDTPGQTPGHDHDPIQHQHKAELAVDGVPLPGGEIKKPEMQKGIKEDMSKCGEGEYWCNKDQKCKPIPKGMKVDKDGILMKEGKKNCGCMKDPCETYGKVEETVMMSGKKEKTMAAIKKNMEKAVDKANKKLKEEAMHEALDNLIQAYGLQEAMSAAEREARRDAAKDKDIGHRKHDPADVDHVYKPEKKRGRGERDLPHIATQLRGVVDMGAKHSGVKFKDGSTKKVHPDHAASWLKKHDSAKPAQKLAMYKSHDSHGEFMKHK